MLNRQLQNKAKELLTKFPILTITGPRQSGKTTFIKHTFSTFEYYSLENPDIRKLILGGPKGFLQNLNEGVIFDEVQRVPDFFLYIQIFSDETQQ